MERGGMVGFPQLCFVVADWRVSWSILCWGQFWRLPNALRIPSTGKCAGSAERAPRARGVGELSPGSPGPDRRVILIARWFSLRRVRLLSSVVCAFL